MSMQFGKLPWVSLVNWRGCSFIATKFLHYGSDVCFTSPASIGEIPCIEELGWHESHIT